MAEEDSKPNCQRRQDLRPASAPASQEEPAQQVCGTRQGSMSSGWGGLAQQCTIRSKHPRTQHAAATQRFSSGVKCTPREHTRTERCFCNDTVRHSAAVAPSKVRTARVQQGGMRTGRCGASMARLESVDESTTYTSANVSTASMHQPPAAVVGANSWLAPPPAAQYGTGLYWRPCKHHVSRKAGVA